MTLVFRWPRRTVFKIISFLSLCFTLFYNWSSSSPTLRAHDWWVPPPVRQEPSLPPLQGRLPHLQLVSPFGSKLWNLPCSRVFLKSAVVFLFRLSYHLANGVFYLLLDCKVCCKSSHLHRYGTVYNFTWGVWIISKTIYTTHCIPLRVLWAQWYPSTRP